MSECPQHKETLILDIFGELDRNCRDAWKRHLSNCPGCTAEKDAIVHALKIVKTTLDAPSLGEVEAASMRERVIRDLNIVAKNPRERKQPFFFSRAFVPVLASACLLLIAAGFMASKLLIGPEISTGSRLTAMQEQLPADDLAIINNLDLLTNLDALNKLAKAIDRSQPPSRHNNVQGKNSHGKKSISS